MDDELWVKDNFMRLFLPYYEEAELVYNKVKNIIEYVNSPLAEIESYEMIEEEVTKDIFLTAVGVISDALYGDSQYELSDTYAYSIEGGWNCCTIDPNGAILIDINGIINGIKEIAEEEKIQLTPVEDFKSWTSEKLCCLLNSVTDFKFILDE